MDEAKNFERQKVLIFDTRISRKQKKTTEKRELFFLSRLENYSLLSVKATT